VSEDIAEKRFFSAKKNKRAHDITQMALVQFDGNGFAF